MRMPRLDFPGSRHHVMSRGARREPVFFDDASRALFLNLLAALPRRFGIRVHGYALMPNHYHLMLESVHGELPRGMRHLNGEYTRQLNTIHHWDGPLFRGRYRNRLVGTNAYWRHLLVYLHLNPIRADLDDDGAWTSHAAYTGDEPRPEWLVTEELQRLFGDQAAYLAHYQAVLDGSDAGPEDFDAKKLWSPHTTGSVAVPDLHAPLHRVSEALAQVCRATGSTLEEVLTTPRGRRSNPRNWLAAWWMSRGCGISHGDIAAALGTSHSGVSKRVARVERGSRIDPRFDDWVAALRQRKDPFYNPAIFITLASASAKAAI